MFDDELSRYKCGVDEPRMVEPLDLAVRRPEAPAGPAARALHPVCVWIAGPPSAEGIEIGRALVALLRASAATDLIVTAELGGGRDGSGGPAADLDFLRASYLAHALVRGGIGAVVVGPDAVATGRDVRALYRRFLSVRLGPPGSEAIAPTGGPLGRAELWIDPVARGPRGSALRIVEELAHRGWSPTPLAEEPPATLAFL
jgi:hypothetical protein